LTSDGTESFNLIFYFILFKNEDHWVEPSMGRVFSMADSVVRAKFNTLKIPKASGNKKSF
jgi:hypothetical protein